MERSLRAGMDDHLLPGTGLDPERFWAALAAIVAEFGRRNAAFLDPAAPRSKSLSPWSAAIRPRWDGRQAK